MIKMNTKNLGIPRVRVYLWSKMVGELKDGTVAEVFNVKVPGDSLGYIKLSDDGKIMLVSGKLGDFYLYKAVREDEENE